MGIMWFTPGDRVRIRGDEKTPFVSEVGCIECWLNTERAVSQTFPYAVLLDSRPDESIAYECCELEAE